MFMHAPKYTPLINQHIRITMIQSMNAIQQKKNDDKKGDNRKVKGRWEGQSKAKGINSSRQSCLLRLLRGDFQKGLDQ